MKNQQWKNIVEENRRGECEMELEFVNDGLVYIGENWCRMVHRV